MVKGLHIIIRGGVQGVFFRAFAKETADSLGIKGFVRNTDDGCVEIVIQGDDPALKEFLERCRKGPSSAKVDKLEVREEEMEEFDRFEVRC